MEGNSLSGTPSTIKQRILAVVLTLLDELPDMVDQTKLDTVTKKIVVSLVQKQLPNIIKNALTQSSEEELERQVLYIRDEVIPAILDRRTDSDENKT